MRKTCYGLPVGDYKGWLSTANYILDRGVKGAKAEASLRTLCNILENAKFESKRPMVIRFAVATIGDAAHLDEFKKCFTDHIMYMDTEEVLFAARTKFSSSPIFSWRMYYPNADV